MHTQVLDSLKLQAHDNIIFGTGGMYLALVGLKQPLNVGDRVPVTLVIEMSGKKQTVQVEAEVKRLELSYRHYTDPNVKDHR
jgi:copper(I)-binding protein